MSAAGRDTDDLMDAAAVHAAREAIVQALGQLAARPLDEHATAQMRKALERVESAEVRRAIRRLTKGGPRPPLVIVPSGPNGRDATGRGRRPPGFRPRESALALAGGAA